MVLTGRSGRGQTSGALETLGNSVAVMTAIRADVSTLEDVALAAAAATSHVNVNSPGFTLVHASGILADDTLGSQSTGGVRSVAAPKVGGAIRLLGTSSVAAGASGPAVLFSSITALLGKGVMNLCTIISYHFSAKSTLFIIVMFSDHM